MKREVTLKTKQKNNNLEGDWMSSLSVTFDASLSDHWTSGVDW